MHSAVVLLIVSAVSTRCSAESVPWQAGIYRPSADAIVLQCGGSLISTNMVVTAASCFWDVTSRPERRLGNLDKFQVALGKVYREWNQDSNNKNVQKFRISHVILEPGFDGFVNRNLAFDIALVKLAGEAILTSYVQPVAMAFSPGTPAIGSFGTVSGWGQAEDLTPSNQLRTITLPFVDQDTCYATLTNNWNKNLLTPDKFCAGNGKERDVGVSPGDAGGGFVVRDHVTNTPTLRGVLSVIFRPRTVPSMFTNICTQRYLTWIHSHLASTGVSTQAAEERFISALASIGKVTAPSAVPWHASIYKKTGSTHVYRCGGTLVSPNLVLTAAHCFLIFLNTDSEIIDNKNVKDYQVTLGKVLRQWHQDNSNKNVQRFNISDVILEPGFQFYVGRNLTLSFHLALVRLAGDATLTPHVQPAAIALEPDAPATGCVVTIAGWGQAEDLTFHQEVRAINFPSIGLDKCQDALVKNRHLWRAKACSGGSYQRADICPGIYGGGVVVRDHHVTNTATLIGVASLDFRPRHTGHAQFFLGTYTNIGELRYRNWINTHVSDRSIGSRQPAGQWEPSWAIGFIIGGTNAVIEDYPYQLSLLRYGSHHCGAAIISESTALTAAHCMTVQGNIYKLRAGSSLRDEGGVVHEVNNIVVHPKFEPNNLDYDFALLRVSTPFKFNDNVKRIALPTLDEVTPVGSLTAVSGWGHLLEGGPAAIELQLVTVPIMDLTQCQTYLFPKEMTNRMICAGIPRGGIDSCQGDSGGPMAFKGELIGVVSWGTGCARPGKPGVYARVSSVRDWIEHNAADDVQASSVMYIGLMACWMCGVKNAM